MPPGRAWLAPIVVGLANYKVRSLGLGAEGHLIISTVGRGNDQLVKLKGLPPTQPWKEKRVYVQMRA